MSRKPAAKEGKVESAKQIPVIIARLIKHELTILVAIKKCARDVVTKKSIHQKDDVIKALELSHQRTVIIAIQIGSGI